MSDCSSSQAGSDYYEPEPEQLYDAHITPLLEAITAARTDQDGWDRGSEEAIKTLEALVRDVDNGMDSAAAIAAADGVYCLSAMLKGQDDENVDEGEHDLPARVAASAHVILAHITALPECRDQFAEAGVYLDLCVGCVEEGALDDQSVQMAASALANLCSEASEVSTAVVEAGAVAGLVSLLLRWAGAEPEERGAAERTALWASAALSNLSQAAGDATAALVEADAAAVIKAALCCGHETDAGRSIEQFLCGCLCNIALADPHALVAAGGIETALGVMQESATSRGKQAALQVISNLQQHSGEWEIAESLRDAGAVETLKDMRRAKSPKALRRSIETALEELEPQPKAIKDKKKPKGASHKPKGKNSKKSSSSSSSSSSSGSKPAEPPPAVSPQQSQRRLPTPSRAHIWVRDAEASECSDCGKINEMWCQRCEACKSCHSHGHTSRYCDGGDQGLGASEPPAEPPKQDRHHRHHGEDQPHQHNRGGEDQPHHHGHHHREEQFVATLQPYRAVSPPPSSASVYSTTSQAFSPETAAALLRARNWNARTIEALLLRPEKLLSVVAALTPSRAASPCSQPRQSRGYGYGSPPRTAPGRMTEYGQPIDWQGAGWAGGGQFATPQQPSTSGGSYFPGRSPARATTAAAQFGRSTNVTALPLWGIEVYNLFLPTGLAPRSVVFRCFGEAFARTEDLVDVSLMQKYAVAVLTFSYVGEETAVDAHAALQEDPRVQSISKGGWPLRLVREGRLIKTYVQSKTGDGEVDGVKDIFGSCPGAPKYDECEVLRDAPLDEAEEHEEESDELLLIARGFEAGHLRCFYRNQTDISEFSFACANAGFSTRQLGVVERCSEWDENRRNTPTKGRPSTAA